jgi:hypothetical protein
MQLHAFFILDMKNTEKIVHLRLYHQDFVRPESGYSF